ncbi:lysine--tRNA ligase [Candidatus Parcubacteria bacterium]|nr:lysine--tRNA ligase [Candidatus Parcubacteria bacterium]
MLWLNKIIDEAEKLYPEGEILVESGISPSGNYHMGYLREILTCDAVVLELKRRGRKSKHIHFVDDQDGFRKVPANLPEEYAQYLGQPLCDMPAPDGSGQTYADYSLKPFLKSVEALGVEMEVIRSHRKYREGYFVPAIELVLSHIGEVRKVLEEISGRQLDENWSPIQVNEAGCLKKRPFVGINVDQKTIKYLDKNGQEQTAVYKNGRVKLDWRIDWPARWWLQGINIEPFGKDHATKGGSYETGKGLMDRVFKAPAPLPIPYDFINQAGKTTKMSASKGDAIGMRDVVQVLPPEVARFFIFRSPPNKLLFFDPQNVAKLIDEFAELLAKENKDEADKQLIELCENGVDSIVSSIPFSHLVASYQSALRDPNKTIEVISRTEYGPATRNEAGTILAELKFIANWLDKWAPKDIKFSLNETSDKAQFSEAQKDYLRALADKIQKAPANAGGEWFHKAIYDFKDKTELEPKQLFQTLYRVIIGKDSGPRAGWFLSILPRDWLIKRLRFEE